MPAAVPTSQRWGLWLRVAVGIEAVGALAIRVSMLAGRFDRLDGALIPDDTYYTLDIARSLARGQGPTADGHTLTSGFQPLLGFLLVPVFRSTDRLQAAVRVDLALLVVCDAALVIVLAWLAHRLAGPVAALVAGGIWAVSPTAVVMAIGGLETSLAMLCEFGLVAAWLWANDAPSVRRWIAVGIVAGLVPLARIDGVVLVALLGLLQLWRGPRRPLLTAAPVALVVLAPWWGYCLAHFGTVMPTSGPAARLGTLSQSFSARTLGLVAGSVVNGAFLSQSRLRTTWADRGTVWPFWGLLAAFIVLGAAMATTGSRSRERAGAQHERDAHLLAALPLFCAALMIAYAWYSVSFYLHRYLAPTAGVTTILVAVLAARAVQIVQERSAATRLVASTAVGASVVALSIPMGLNFWHVTRLEHSRGITYDELTGFYAPSEAALADLRPGTTVGSHQSGALAYIADRRYHVVNLDGVVNPPAFKAIRDRHLGSYLRAQHIDHLIDSDLILIYVSLIDHVRLHLTAHVISPHLPRLTLATVEDPASGE